LTKEIGFEMTAYKNHNMKFNYWLLLTALAVATCTPKQNYPVTGSIETLDAGLNEVLAADARIEIVGEGFEWSEGPLWLASEGKLIFSDVPENLIYEWSESGGVKRYLAPSGFTGDSQAGESGSNGLAVNEAGELVLCQHGDRQVAVMKAPLADPEPLFETIASEFGGRKFNSPNDLHIDRQQRIWFTDPPYGLPGQDNDPAKEQVHNGVYRAARGQVELLIDSLTRPNGIALSPDESKLYVANSDAGRARWYEYDVAGDSLTRGRILYDATSFTATEKGLPDGLKVDRKGNVFATGPGGVWIFNSTGKLLGKVKLPEETSNCALTPDGKFLFVTMDMYLVRIALK
jgi:gluconolactonase